MTECDPGWTPIGHQILSSMPDHLSAKPGEFHKLIGHYK
jgi:hypothetical protein